MPLYEYSCEKCHTVVEKIQKFSDPPLLVCEKCGGPLVKLMGKPALQFKGSGFYITDYVKKSGEEKPTNKETKSEAATTEASAPASSPQPAVSSPVTTSPAASES